MGLMGQLLVVERSCTKKEILHHCPDHDGFSQALGAQYEDDWKPLRLCTCE